LLFAYNDKTNNKKQRTIEMPKRKAIFDKADIYRCKYMCMRQCNVCALILTHNFLILLPGARRHPAISVLMGGLSATPI